MTTAASPRYTSPCTSWTASATRTGCSGGERRGYATCARELAEEAGRGRSVYTGYDTKVADAHRPLDPRTRRSGGTAAGHGRCSRRWVSPHYPLTRPGRVLRPLRGGVELPRPRLYDPAERPDHPAIDHYRATWNYDDHFDEERAPGRAHRLLRALLLPRLPDRPDPRRPSRKAASPTTRSSSTPPTTAKTSATGGLWGKCVMYEESSGVPLLARGAGDSRGNAVRRPGLPRGHLPHGGRVRVRGARRARAGAPRREPRRPRPRADRRTASFSARCTTTAR